MVFSGPCHLQQRGNRGLKRILDICIYTRQQHWTNPQKGGRKNSLVYLGTSYCQGFFEAYKFGPHVTFAAHSEQTCHASTWQTLVHF